MLVINLWNGRLHWLVMMVYSLFGNISEYNVDHREDGKIIRENVNGTKEVIVDEGNMIHVLSKMNLLIIAYESNAS
jgi:hypothetical protein